MFTLAFWKNALEAVLVAFVTTFAGSLAITTTPDLKGLEAAALAGGMGALYALVKQLGAVQSAKSITKVDTPTVSATGAK